MIRVPIHNQSEAQFAWEQDRAGKTWFHQPKKFALPEPWSSYTPDFYVVEDQCFYEILGSTSAPAHSLGKREAFRARYPHLKLIEVYMGAWKQGPRGPMKNKPARAYTALQHETRGFAAASPPKPRAAELVRMAKALKIKSYTELGAYVGLPYSRLWCAINRANYSDNYIEMAISRLVERAADAGVPA